MGLVRSSLVFVAVVTAFDAFVACGARTELDAPELADAEIDAPKDVKHEADAIAEDAIEELPTIDQFVDAPIPTDCPDAGSTLIYVLSGENDLYSFYPPTLAFTSIGMLDCPDPSGAGPFSMAVDRRGIAYSVFTDGNLFRVDTENRRRLLLMRTLRGQRDHLEVAAGDAPLPRERGENSRSVHSEPPSAL